MIGVKKRTDGITGGDTRSPEAVVRAELSVKNLDNLTRHYRQPAARAHAEQFARRSFAGAAA